MLPEYLAREYPRWGEYDDATKEDIAWLYDDRLNELTSALEMVVKDLNSNDGISEDTKDYVISVLKEA